MTRFLASAALAASMLAAVPAAAQDYRPAPGYGSPAYGNQGYGAQGSDFWRGAPSDPWQRIDYLQQRIDTGLRDGSLSPQQARPAQVQLRQIRRDATRMRRGGYMSADNMAMLQTRLDALSRNLRWARRNNDGAYGAQGYGPQGYGPQGYGNQGYGAQGYSQADMSRFSTSYDAQRYYRDGPQYGERRLTDADQVYRGSDGRYYCQRSDGTTGLILGGAGGALIGNAVDGGHERTAGTLIGGALGALLGHSIEQSSEIRCR